MKYSAGMVKKLFWYLESKKTVPYILEGLSRKEIQEIAITENLYQVESENRAQEIASNVYTRLNSLPEDIQESILKSDITTSKVLVLISIMKTDRLFFEFMYEVYRNNIILGDFTLKDREINLFFQDKKEKSETVDKWVEATIKKLKSTYIAILTDAGLIRIENDKKEITVPYMDYHIKQKLIQEDMDAYVYAITGEK